jgi:uncharacterized protein
MPLLLCPNDNGSMQTVQRSGIEFDICPTCRGEQRHDGQRDWDNDDGYRRKKKRSSIFDIFD